MNGIFGVSGVSIYSLLHRSKSRGTLAGTRGLSYAVGAVLGLDLEYVY